MLKKCALPDTGNHEPDEGSGREDPGNVTVVVGVAGAIGVVHNSVARVGSIRDVGEGVGTGALCAEHEGGGCHRQGGDHGGERQRLELGSPGQGYKEILLSSASWTLH